MTVFIPNVLETMDFINHVLGRYLDISSVQRAYYYVLK